MKRTKVFLPGRLVSATTPDRAAAADRLMAVALMTEALCLLDRIGPGPAAATLALAISRAEPAAGQTLPAV